MQCRNIELTGLKKTTRKTLNYMSVQMSSAESDFLKTYKHKERSPHDLYYSSEPGPELLL